MLGILVAAVNAAQNGLYLALYGSYKIGSILVTLVKTIIGYFSLVFESLTTIFNIFVESISIFLQDILQYNQNILNFILTGCEVLTTNTSALTQGIFTCITRFLSTILLFYNSILNTIWNVVTNIGELFILGKNLIVLLGSGVWFAVTLIPLLIYYFMSLSVTFIQELILETYQVIWKTFLSFITGVKNVILFTIDIPVESLFGLLIAVSLAYIFFQFYVLIYNNLIQVWDKCKSILIRLKNRLFSTIRQTLIRQQNRFIYRRQIRPHQNVSQTSRRLEGRPGLRTPLETRLQKRKNLNKSILNLETTEDKFCVICQERNKCILLLPCRHLCLCSECNRELRYYNDVCPICRTDIESTMKIFV